MSEANQIQRAYAEKMRLFFKILRENRLSRGWDAFPRTLSDGAAKLLSQADINRMLFGTGPENVILNAIGFHDEAFWNADKATRGSLRAHNEALSEEAVQKAINFRDHCRLEKQRRSE
jgi:hypothetical protein